jgi:hypothetical protein
LPDFSWYNVPNGNKIYQMAGKLTKWPQNTPTSSIARPSQIYPTWDLWFENTPFGNPVHDSKNIFFCAKQSVNDNDVLGAVFSATTNSARTRR